MKIDTKITLRECPYSRVEHLFSRRIKGVHEVFECLPIYFSGEPVAVQFYTPGLLNRRLRAVILYTAWFFEAVLREPLIITHLLRIQAEQDSIYRDNPTYKDTPWKSVHQFGRGCDIRTRHLIKTQQAHLRRRINTSFPYDADGSHPTVLLERDHLHFQVCALAGETVEEYVE